MSRMQDAGHESCFEMTVSPWVPIHLRIAISHKVLIIRQLAAWPRGREALMV